MSQPQPAAGWQGRAGGHAVLRAACAVVLSLAPTVAAAGAPGSGLAAALVLGAVRSGAVGRTWAPPSPRVGRGMPGRVEAKLDRAFALAVHRLDTRSECRALFARLGRDGMSELSTTLYLPASPERERGVCRRALASTHVGGPATSVCGRFDALPDAEAAMVLLHEALHWSGLTERPMDPHGMSASDIYEMVREACGL